MEVRGPKLNYRESTSYRLISNLCAPESTRAIGIDGGRLPLAARASAVSAWGGVLISSLPPKNPLFSQYYDSRIAIEGALARGALALC
jgi:hypothetical protein